MKTDRQTPVRLASEHTSSGSIPVHDSGEHRGPSYRQRSRRRGRSLELAVSLLLVVVLLVTAQILARANVVSDLLLPAPTDVWRSLVDGFSSGLYWTHIRSTLVAMAGGFFIATAIAVAMAGILASVPVLERVLVPFVMAFQSMPKVAIAPLLVLYLGFGDNSKLAIVVIVCFFPIFIPALQGLKIRDRDQLDVFRALGASRWCLFRRLRLPNALPYIFAGLHMGVVFSLIGSVVAEFVGSQSGLGVVLLQQKTGFNLPGVFAVLVILMAMGLLFDRGMALVEKRVAFWAQDQSDSTSTGA